MTRSELLEKIQQEKQNIGGWGIMVGPPMGAGFLLGCYFDQKENQWRIYETDERGIEEPLYKVDNEEDAYDKLNKLIMIHKKLNAGHFGLEDHFDGEKE